MRRSLYKVDDKYDNISNAEAAEHKNLNAGSKAPGEKSKTKSPGKTRAPGVIGAHAAESGSEDLSMLGESAESGSEMDQKAGDVTVTAAEIGIRPPRTPSRGIPESDDETSHGKLVIDTEREEDAKESKLLAGKLGGDRGATVASPAPGKTPVPPPSSMGGPQPPAVPPPQPAIEGGGGGGCNAAVANGGTSSPEPRTPLPPNGQATS
ncbi:hypothetical protein B566_EDAN012583 [Ephemera danica]|nr:hypothetical protein B566_EDAN012583 [Ephemera danica]